MYMTGLSIDRSPSSIDSIRNQGLAKSPGQKAWALGQSPHDLHGHTSRGMRIRVKDEAHLQRLQAEAEIRGIQYLVCVLNPKLSIDLLVRHVRLLNR